MQVIKNSSGLREIKIWHRSYHSNFIFQVGVYHPQGYRRSDDKERTAVIMEKHIKCKCDCKVKKEVSEKKAPRLEKKIHEGTMSRKLPVVSRLSSIQENFASYADSTIR